MADPIDVTSSPLVAHGSPLDHVSGRLLVVADAQSEVHAIDVEAGRVIAVRRHRLREDLAGSTIVAFGGSLLACRPGSLATELDAAFAPTRVVDLAGGARQLIAPPVLDRSGALHLVAGRRSDGMTHAVVSSGGFTRRSRALLLDDVEVRALFVATDTLLLAADGRIGVGPIVGRPRLNWMATGAHAPDLIIAREVDETIVVLALTPALERWTLHPSSGVVQREPLAHGRGQASGLVSVADGEWIAGFSVGDTTDLQFVEASMPDGLPVASIRLPHTLASPLRSAWIPVSQPTIPEGP